jgi:hypothetical protein
MSVDIFEFWSSVGPADKCHPKDREVLSRMKGAQLFDLRCLPHCFVGPLKTAPVVLLYLSPGLDEKDDLRDARTRAGRDRYMECRKGKQLLPGPEENRAGWQWWKSRTKDIGEWQQLRSKVAVLNIGPYHSKKLPNTSILAALPSSRFTLEWAQSVLFPQAVSGERVVVCLRAARFWGLDTGKFGKRFGEALFAPRTTRSGHMLYKRMREEIIEKARAAIGRA